jgi:hypothetical protein
MQQGRRFLSGVDPAELPLTNSAATVSKAEFCPQHHFSVFFPPSHTVAGRTCRRWDEWVNGCTLCGKHRVGDAGQY